MTARYTVIEVVGAGACSHVCVARRRDDPPDAPCVALKVLRPELVHDLGVTTRLRDEARILEHLSHPMVVSVHGLYDYDGRLVMEMEWVEGASLEKVLQGHGPVPTHVALGVVRSVAEAMSAAWTTPGPDGRPMHIVHRDLKPGNIAFGVDGTIKLLDFGYAKGDFDGRAAQSLHQVWGTIGFDAPERSEGQADPRGDVYSLGVTLFVMLTQRPMLLSTQAAHHDEDLDQLLDHLSVGDFEDLDGLKALIRHCVRFDASARPDMGALIAAVDALVAPADAQEAVTRFSATVVKEGREGRAVQPADASRDWAVLEFLEQVGPTPQQVELGKAEVAQRVRTLLARPDWEQRVAELEPLIVAMPLDPAPFHAVLDRAVVPVWKIWQKPARPGEVEAALLVLARLDRRVASSRARALLDHGNERVRKAAAFVAGSGD